MPEIRQYKIDVPQVKLDRLKQKLEHYEWPTELEDVGWDYGPPQKDIKRFYNHWKDKFDWRAHEKKMNDTLPQFETTVNVEGFGDIDMHFIHQKSDVEGAIPLCFVHGWPGSFLEVTKMLPLLKGGKRKACISRSSSLIGQLYFLSRRVKARFPCWQGGGGLSQGHAGIGIRPVRDPR